MAQTNFPQFQQDADACAQCVVRALQAGNVALAVEHAAILTANFPHLAEGYALSAVTLDRAQQTDAALNAWDEALRLDPMQTAWLESALHLASQAKAKAYTTRWTVLLENLFLAPPSVSLLQNMEASGWQGVGSVGIHDGELRGWTWQPVDDKPQIAATSLSAQSDQPVALEDSLEISHMQRFKTATRALNIFRIPLPQQPGMLAVTVCDALGRQAHASPAVSSVLLPRKTAPPNLPVAVIVPVYAERELTLRCLGSVLASKKHCRTPLELVVVWDHGPDPALLTALQRLAARGKLTLHTPPHNLGFLGAVNFALEQHPRQSVVLLNADAFVCNDWLDRLHRIGSRPQVGSVTPLGTHAELLSFPYPQAKVDPPCPADARRMDAACKQAGKTTEIAGVLDIPVGVGFCMYIPRSALDTVGGLDGRSLFRGYGEEVDFCLRLRKAGLRNLAACNVFVAHAGERSFGLGKRALAVQNNAYLFGKYPDYKAEYDAFLRADPLRRLRERVAKCLVRPLNGDLHVGTVLDGLAPEFLYIKEDASATGAHCAVLLLKPCGVRIRAMLRLTQGLPVPDMHFELPQEYESLRRTLVSLSPKQVQLHGTGQLAQQVIERCGLDATSGAEGSKQHTLDVTLQSISLQNLKNATWILPSPRTVTAWKQLCAVARQVQSKGHRFWVVQLEAFWQGCPRPSNVQQAPNPHALATLTAGVLFLEAEDATPHWQRWAEAHSLPLHVLDLSPVQNAPMPEALCA